MIKPKRRAYGFINMSIAYMIYRWLSKCSPLLFLLLISLNVSAQGLRVAVAANANFVLQQLKADFKKKTGISIEVIGGSSGKLATQIKNGAPYDLFLSADMGFAEDVYKAGFSSIKPRIYASGSLIVCSSTGANLKNWKSLITDKNFGKVAIGNPALAPYGKAAEQAMNYYNIYKEAAPQLVFGESISQVNTYVLKKAVNIGFTTESLVYELPSNSGMKWLRVDPVAYQPIHQGVLLLKHADSNLLNCKRFYDYLFSAAAKKIFKAYGYSL